MTDHIPAVAREAAHCAAVARLQSLYSGRLPDSVAREIADAALGSAWPAIENHIRQTIADEFTRRGKNQDSFTWGEAALLARGEM